MIVEYDKSLKSISKSFEKFDSLRSIALIFESCSSKITDQGLKNLSDGLKRLKTLQFINLDLFSSNKITSQGLKTLSAGLKTICSLHSIHLSFCFSLRVTNRWLDDIRECLREIGSLVFVSLNFSYCYQITDQGLKNLCEHLRLFTTLKSMYGNHKSRDERSQTIQFFAIYQFRFLKTRH